VARLFLENVDYTLFRWWRRFSHPLVAVRVSRAFLLGLPPSVTFWAFHHWVESHPFVKAGFSPAPLSVLLILLSNIRGVAISLVAQPPKISSKSKCMRLHQEKDRYPEHGWSIVALSRRAPRSSV